jgi:tripartite-type tricarboxylate transporter receptor subunit TctC
MCPPSRKAGCPDTKRARGTAWTPPEIIAALNAETRRIFEDPAFRDTVLAPNFIFSIVSSPDAFAERIRSEWAKWGEVIRDAGLKPE